MGESHSDAGSDLGFDFHAGCTFYSNLPNPIQIYQTDNSLTEKVSHVVGGFKTDIKKRVQFLQITRAQIHVNDVQHPLVFLNLIHRASNRGLQWECHGITRSAYGLYCESSTWWLMYMNA
jgi:hypothetical protein